MRGSDDLRHPVLDIGALDHQCVYVNMKRRLPLLCFMGLGVACGSETSEPPNNTNAANNNNVASNNNNTNSNTNNNTVTPPPPAGLPVLGSFSHDVSKVEFTWMTNNATPLNVPRDLAFNPEKPMELWVINTGDESTTVFQEFGTEAQTVVRYKSFGSEHFLARPSALAFGASGTWASIHETDELTQGPNGTPEDFMGPTLWTANLDDFDSGHGSHMDMLHNSPLGMGIAWDKDNVYWVFDGHNSSLTRYDFNQDHGLGGSDHSDGFISRYAEGEVLRSAEVPSHMEMDRVTHMLYAADTGNNRIARLDTTSGTQGGRLFPNYDGINQFKMNDAVLDTFVEGADFGMQAPSGLAIQNGVLYVGDNVNSTLYAFDLETGELLDFLPLAISPGGLMGIELDAEGNLYGIDVGTERVFRIRPTPES